MMMMMTTTTTTTTTTTMMLLKLRHSLHKPISLYISVPHPSQFQSIFYNHQLHIFLSLSLSLLFLTVSG